MTVTSSTSKSRYTGNGVTLAFTGSFRILDEDHVTVTHTSTVGVDTVKTITTDYTVSGVGGSSFTVTHLVAPASGVIVTLSRNVPATQELDLVENDDMPADELEKAFDKVTMLFQQSGEAQDRSLKFPVSDSASLSAELPSAANRVGYLLGFDSNGEPTMFDPATGFSASENVAAFAGLVSAANKFAYFTASDGAMALATLTTFGRTLAALADAAAGRTALGTVIGTDVQAQSANLDEYAAVNPTAAGLALLDDADAAAQRTTLGIANHHDIVVSAAGEATNSLQPAFMAYTSARINDVTGDSTDYTIIFDAERFDQNADFSTSTGKFTAPVTGRYQLNATVSLLGFTGSHNLAIIAISTSNALYRTYRYNPTLVADANQYIGCGAILADMDAGDTAEIVVRVQGGTKVVDVEGSATNLETTFSGFLAC